MLSIATLFGARPRGRPPLVLCLTAALGASGVVAGCRASNASCGADPSCANLGGDGGLYQPPPPPDSSAPPPTPGCQAVDLTHFQPVPVKPLVKAACTDAQIHAIATGCFGMGSDNTSCVAAQNDPANETCLQANCIF